MDGQVSSKPESGGEKGARVPPRHLLTQPLQGFSTSSRGERAVDLRFLEQQLRSGPFSPHNFPKQLQRTEDPGWSPGPATPAQVT